MTVGVLGQRGTRSVLDFGAQGAISPANLAAIPQETVLFQAAIDDSPAGGAVHVPERYWKVGALQNPRQIRLFGDGWWSNHLAAYGVGGWLVPSNHGGTVIFSTAPGIALNHDALSGSRFNVDHLALIGPGTAGSVGVKLGTATRYSLDNRWDDVLIANFDKGLDFYFAMGGQYDNVKVRGTNTFALSLADFCNATLWNNYHQEYTGVDGVIFGAGGPHKFVGGISQNIVGTGFRASLATSELVELLGMYYEAHSGGAGFHVDFAAGSHHGLGGNYHFSSNGGNVRMGCNNGYVGPGRGNGNTITNTGIANKFEAPGMGFAGGVDGGTGPIYIFPSSTLGRFHSKNGVFQPGSSTTAARPSAVTALVGAMWYDTTLGKPIFSDGAVWRDAAGAAV
jgi:hypothetical protein